MKAVVDTVHTSAAPSRRKAMAIVLAMVAIPAVYYGLDNTGTTPLPVGAQAAGTTLADLEHTASVQPTTANRINLSQALIAGAQYGRAAEVLAKVVAQDPRSATAWNNLCVAHTLQQDLSHAVEDCQQGLRVEPSYQLLRNNLKWAEDETAKVRTAIAEQEKTPPGQRSAAFHLEEGINFLHLGSYDQAIVAWHRTLALSPNNSLAYNNIGTAQMLQHHYTEAQASFQRAAALDPGNQLVRNNLAWAQTMLKPAR